MHKISNPHDRFFRQSLSDKKIAMDFFEAHLPRNILATIDLNSLEICKESYIEEDLRESIDDIYGEPQILDTKNPILKGQFECKLNCYLRSNLWEKNTKLILKNSNLRWH
jgi:predicted transposase YdaD